MQCCWCFCCQEEHQCSSGHCERCSPSTAHHCSTPSSRQALSHEGIVYMCCLLTFDTCLLLFVDVCSFKYNYDDNDICNDTHSAVHFWPVMGSSTKFGASSTSTSKHYQKCFSIFSIICKILLKRKSSTSKTLQAPQHKHIYIGRKRSVRLLKAGFLVISMHE